MGTKCGSILTSLLLTVLVVTLATSCSKDDTQPIQLNYGTWNDKPNPVTDNQFYILLPTSEKRQLLISGGDGDFTVTNSDDKVIAISKNDRLIDIMPLSTGSAVVTVTDKSGNSYMLTVTVNYREQKVVITKQDIIVIGDKLSEVQKTAIRQKAALTLPVEVNGGFKFVYKTDDETLKGQVFIYKKEYGVDGIESVFEQKRIEIKANGDKVTLLAFVITIDGKQRNFILTKYIAPKSKSLPPAMMIALNEELTDQFKTEYPDVEFVYTQQGFMTR